MAFTPTAPVLRCLFILIIIASGPILSESAKTFTIVNYCKETIWPAITNGENFTGGGFALKQGQSAVYTAPAGWHGRIWGRTGCNFDKNSKGTCETGSCGTLLNCTSPGSPPTSIAEFTLGDIDFYDVSLVDGFNLPIVVKPSNGKGNCSTAGCDGDLRQNCPSELQAKDDGKVTACRSACDVFKTDEYCCRGMFGNPMTCLPTNYSRSFKQFCPAAYSYAYDDPTSIITCSGADYTVSFCGSSIGDDNHIRRWPPSLTKGNDHGLTTTVTVSCNDNYRLVTTTTNLQSKSRSRRHLRLRSPMSSTFTPHYKTHHHRNQTMCSYHDNKLICNGSKSLRTVLLSQKWWALVLAITLHVVY